MPVKAIATAPGSWKWCEGPGSNVSMLVLISAEIFFFILYKEPTNEHLIDKLVYCTYKLRHNCVIFIELVVSTC